MAKICILLGIICLIITYCSGYAYSHLLNYEQNERDKIAAIAYAEIGVKELTGNNDGKRVEEYLKVVNLKKGHAWCAAFVSWVFAEAGYPMPRSAWSPALFGARVLTKNVKKGDVFGIYFNSLKRIAHVGIVLGKQDDWLISVEGNTNGGGSRDGDGVYKRRRHIKSIYAYADWASQKGGAK